MDNEDLMSELYGDLWGSDSKKYYAESIARSYLWSFLSRFGVAEHRLWINKIDDINWPKANPDGSVDVTVPVVNGRVLKEEQLLDVWRGSEKAYIVECRRGMEAIARENIKLVEEMQACNVERSSVGLRCNAEIYNINCEVRAKYNVSGCYDETQHANRLNICWDIYNKEIYEIDRRIACLEEKHRILESQWNEINQCQQYYISSVRYLNKAKAFVVTVRKK